MAVRRTWSGLESRCAEGNLCGSGATPPWTGQSSVTTRALDRRQRLVEIGEDIVHILYTNGDADHAVGDADFAAALFADAGVSHRSGMRNQGLDSAQGFGERTDAHLAEHLIGVRER